LPDVLKGRGCEGGIEIDPNSAPWSSIVNNSFGTGVAVFSQQEGLSHELNAMRVPGISVFWWIAMFCFYGYGGIIIYGYEIEFGSESKMG